MPGVLIGTLTRFLMGDPPNYRPISIIPVVAKVFERIVYDQLYRYLTENKLLCCYQSGFRTLHSTVTALIEATDSWTLNIDRGFVNAVVFVDFKKAFETLTHQHAFLRRRVSPIRDVLAYNVMHMWEGRICNKYE